MLRPVICAIALTTAWRSACWKLSSTSPARGVIATVPGARAPVGPGGAGGTGAAGGGSFGATPGCCSCCGSGACAKARCAASAAARTAVEKIVFMSRGSPPSAHVVVEGFVATLALHLDQHALRGSELLVELHHVLH